MSLLMQDRLFVSALMERAQKRRLPRAFRSLIFYLYGKIRRLSAVPQVKFYHILFRLA
jgi:hypothetical protein